MIRTQISKNTLIQAADTGGLIDNKWFEPVQQSSAALHQMNLVLSIAQTEMACNHHDVEVTGRRIDLFPECQIRLTQLNDQLIPVDRDLIRAADGNSYWDISFSPGKVWSETTDQGWSRAALPFQLSNIFENDSHHGIAAFLFNGNAVSTIYFQITTQTKSFVAPDNILLWGFLNAHCDALDHEVAASAIESFKIELGDQRSIRDLGGFNNRQTRDCFEDIENGYGSDSSVVSGLVMDDQIYITKCQSAAGDYPFPRAMKFGIWSATKTAFGSIACLRLAQITGEDPRQARVQDLIPQAMGKPQWSEVTIGDCLNMASGVGTAGTDDQPLDIFADYLLEEAHAQADENGMDSLNHYFDWFLASSQQQKNTAALNCPGYPWKPGTIARYRDQDLYLAGAAMDAWMKQRLGEQYKIWDLVRDQVYRPAGIHHAIKFQTIESDLKNQVPLTDAGLLLTMDNIAALGKLILDQGRLVDQQILDAQMLQELFDPEIEQGLATGTQTTDGEILYHAGIWRLPYRSNNQKQFWIPTMRGYGGQLIQTLPNGTTVFRFGFDSYETEERYDMLKMVRLSDAIRPF